MSSSSASKRLSKAQNTVNRSMDKNRIGVWAFIGSEATFFALLIIAFIYYRWSGPTANVAGGSARIASGLTARTLLDPVRTGIYSLFLLASSGSMWLSGRSLKRSRLGATTFWLAVTVLFGAIFLFGQGTEWASLVASGVLPRTNEFGSTFFTLTGFHGLHVLIGLLMLAVLSGFALSGALRPGRRGPGLGSLEAIALYWHFVDGVWIVIFSIVYLTILLGLA